MSTRETYPAGVPCWVDVLVENPAGVQAFYGELFGWEFAGPGPMPDGGSYYVARAGGDDVAGVGSLPPGVPGAVWSTYVAVDSVERACARVTAAGGTLLGPSFDAAPAGRGAMVADPTGAAIGLWEAGDRAGARRINEASAWAMSALQTTDPHAAIAFYADVFGWQAWEAPGMPDGLKLLRLDGYVGGEPSQPVPRDVVAAVAPAAPGLPSHWAVDFWIADASAAADAAERLGGSVIAPVAVAPPFHRAVLADADGAAFSVSQLDLSMLPG